MQAQRRKIARPPLNPPVVLECSRLPYIWCWLIQAAYELVFFTAPLNWMAHPRLALKFYGRREAHIASGYLTVFERRIYTVGAGRRQQNF